MRLFRYRPISSLLFKELKYREIYLARHGELNDPQDLTCIVNFYSNDRNRVYALGNFIHRHLIDAHGVIGFMVLKVSFSPRKLGDFLFEKFDQIETELVAQEDLNGLLSEFYSANIKSESTRFDGPVADQLLNSILSTIDVFLKNASVACFSESNNNFQMWSHYAGGHNGVCLEFDTEIFNVEKKNEKSKHGLLTTVDYMHDGKPIEFWTEINKVKYQKSIPTIDFYEIYQALVNKGDTDLMELSKSKWHSYADYIKQAFLHKLEPWDVEREWRIVNVGFKDSMPENRIITYSDKSIKSVCFGANVNTYTQLRIENILGSGLTYYKSRLNGTNEIEIVEIEMDSLKDSYYWG